MEKWCKGLVGEMGLEAIYDKTLAGKMAIKYIKRC